MKHLLSFIFYFAIASVSAQADLKASFKMFTLNHKTLGKIDYCSFNSSIATKKPILLFIHGSGNEPTFAYHKDLKSYAWKAFLELEKYKDKYHVIFVSKPGIPLFDTVQKDPVNFSTSYPVNSEFTQRYSLEWRAEAASAIIDDAIKHLPVERSKIMVIGHSQGGQVAPKVACLNKKVTHVVILNANALNHLYDFVLQERLAAFTNEQSFEKAQQNIDSLYNDYRRVFADPESRTKFWNDETYYRWASFSDETPLENMLKLNIPIYVVGSGKDIYQSNIMNTDYVLIEFIRQKKNNLTYKVYPNANHFLQDEISENGQTKTINIKANVFETIDAWSTSKP